MTQATVEFADIDRLFVKNACLSVIVFVASELEFPITIVQNLADVFLRHYCSSYRSQETGPKDAGQNLSIQFSAVKPRNFGNVRVV
jgi:hypothetical protein